MLTRKSAGVVLVALLFCLSCASSLVAQSFQNLDFEDANVPVLPVNGTGAVSVTNGLPGWSAYIGTNQLAIISENSITLGNANVGVWGPQYYNYLVLPTNALQGFYSAMLQAGGTQNQGLQPVSIAQTGLIPAWAKSMQFEGAFWLLGTTNLQDDCGVTVGGVNTPVVPLGGDLYGCDVSAFAGLEEELSFSMLTNYGNGLMLLDAITFSSEAVPEPSALSLVMMAVAGLGLWRLASRKTR